MRTNFGASERKRKSAFLWIAITIFFVLSLLWLTGSPVAHSQGDTATDAITVSPQTTVAPVDTVTPAEIVPETVTPTAIPPPTSTPTPTLTLVTSGATSIPTDVPPATATPAPSASPKTPPTDTPTPTVTPTNTPTPTDTPTLMPPTATPIATVVPTLSPFQRFLLSLQKRSLKEWRYLIGLAIVLIALVFLFLLRRLRRGLPPEKELAPPAPPVKPTPPPARPGVPYLESLSRPGGRIVFWLESLPVTVGRSPDNDLIIDEQYNGWETVSRRHAEIREDSGRYVLIDNNSMNGVHVNGRRTGKNLLRDGFKVSFGQVEFIFRESSG